MQDLLIAKLESLTSHLNGQFRKMEGSFNGLQTQVDAIDVKMVHGGGSGFRSDYGPDLKRILEENESVQRLMKDGRGKAVLTLSGKDARLFETKTTITSSAVGSATSGVLPIERIPGIVTEARQGLSVRDVLYARPTTAQIIDFVRVVTPMAPASPAAEASIKAENTVTFSTTSERVQTIATWIPASKQILSDATELLGFLKSTLQFYVDIAEEVQLLSGDGTNGNLHGLITQASTFSTGLLSTNQGWNAIDIVGRAIQQITAAKELQPTFIILHPTDWWNMRLQKDSFGRYILGDPQNGGVQSSSGYALRVLQSLFDLTAVITTSIAQGTFLVGSGSPIAAEIRDREELIVEISTEHADYFTRNMVAVRGEKRLALLTKRPGSYVAGTFTRSPQ